MIVFPTEILQPDYSVLCLFASAYGGEHDVDFVHQAGCTDVTLVDRDAATLDATALKYGFKSTCFDAFDFIIFAAATDRHWDVVISDQWSKQDIEINVGYYDMLNRIARKHLCLGYCRHNFKHHLIQPGRYVHRSDHMGGTYWRVIDL